MKDILVHHMNLEVLFFSQLVHRLGQPVNTAGQMVNVHQHHHDEQFLHHRLGHLDHIGIVLGADLADSRQNADRMLYDLLDQGYPAFLLAEDGFFKVQVGAYRQLGNAILMERRLRRDGYSTLITT